MAAKIWPLQPIDFLINCLFSLYELSPCYARQMNLNLRHNMAFDMCPIL